MCDRKPVRRGSWSGPTPNSAFRVGGPTNVKEPMSKDWRGPHLIASQDGQGRQGWAWIPRPASPGNVPKTPKLQLSESLVTDIREIVEQEVTKRGIKSGQNSGLAEELKALRKDVSRQEGELQIYKTQLGLQQEQMQAFAAETREFQNRAMKDSAEDQASLVNEIRSGCFELVSALAKRVKELLHEERESRSAQMQGLRESVTAMLEERLKSTCREERTARLEELSEMHSAVLTLLDEERVALLEHMRKLSLAVREPSCKNVSLADHGGTAVEDPVESEAGKQFLSSDLALRIAKLSSSRAAICLPERPHDSGESLDEQKDMKMSELSRGHHPQTQTAGDTVDCGGSHCAQHGLGIQPSRDTEDAVEHQFLVEAKSCEQKIVGAIEKRRVGGSSTFRLERIAEEPLVDGALAGDEGDRGCMLGSSLKGVVTPDLWSDAHPHACDETARET